MTDKNTGITSQAAGQIAVQTLLSLLINLYIGECEDPEHARNEITKISEEMVDKASIPDLPSANQRAARDQAKQLVRALIVGHRSN